MTNKPTTNPTPDGCGKAEYRFEGFAIDQVNQSIPARFAQIVSRYSNQPAILTDSHQWDYETLDQKSDAVRTTITEQQPSKNPIAIRLGHDAPLIATMFGALKSGKPYIVINPNDPISRQAAILEDAQCQLLITDEAFVGPTGKGIAKIIKTISFEQATLSQAAEHVPAPTASAAPNANDICSITYTSGSTGTPKGIAQSHQNILHQILRYTMAAQLGCDDRFVWFTPGNYAAAVSPIFGSLLNGGTLLPFDLKSADTAALGNWLVDHHITVFQSVPTVFRSLCQELGPDTPLPSLRLIRLGGDMVLTADLRSYQRCPFSDSCRLMVTYSSTETGLVLYSLFDKQDDESGPILPMLQTSADMIVLLMDENGKAVPDDQIGQVTIESSYLAGNARVYQPGDLGRRTSDGCIYITGRVDRQVKIHGHRFELEEIESVLSSLPAARQAAVIVLQRALRPPKLIAYVVPSRSTHATNIDWKAELRKHLPEHMVPPVIIPLKSMPSLANGKVDRASLHRYYKEGSGKHPGRQLPVAEFERGLGRIWESVLDVRPIGMNDDFLDLGGDSLQSMSVLRRIEREFGHTLPPSALMDWPTVARLATALSRRLFDAADSPLVPIQVEGNRRPFFCIHAVDGAAFFLRALGQLLSPLQPVYGLQSPALYGDLSSVSSVEQLASIYAKQIMKTAPNGPCIVSGYCTGGIIALETANQLIQAGAKVDQIIMIDTPLISGVANRLARKSGQVKALRHYAQVGVWKMRLQLNRLLDGSGSIVFSQKYRVAVQQIHHRAIAQHTIRNTSVPVVMLKAQQIRNSDGRDTRADTVRYLDPTPQVIEIPGNHLTCIREPHITSLAQSLDSILDGES
jgi:acyl-coenzyme A synthetase/AMP-(fatty) acid ligase/thioesterase domain-containing protein/acyl carrier protein